MTFLDSFDMLEGNFELSIFIAAIGALWGIVKLAIFMLSIDNKFPKLTVAVDAIVLPFVVLLIGSLANDGHKFLGIGNQSEIFNALTLFGVLLVIGWCAARLFEIFLLSRQKNEDTERLPGLQRGLLFFGFLFLSAIIFFSIMDYSVTGIYVSTGAVAAVFAFAMQRTLGDLFSGVALSIEHPFRLGDWIELEDGTQGQVIDINWRATRLRGWDNATVTVPNGTLAQQRISNMHGANHVYAQWYMIKLPAEVDPRMAKALLLEAAIRCDKLLKKPLPSVRLADVTKVPYEYSVWVHFPDFFSMFAGREQLFREIHCALQEAGIRITPEIYELHTREIEATVVEAATNLRILQGLDFAKFLTNEELEQLADTSDRHTYDAGTTIISEGEISQCFEIIVHGIVETSVERGRNPLETIGEIVPGQYYGLYSMIAEGPSFQKFSAATDVTVMRVHIEHIRALLIKRPDLSEAFAKIVEFRMEKAQEVRMKGDAPKNKLSFYDILNKIEGLVS
jgi:small-conductance mechanosensitive channel/CRP-like cAMP-binding protein